MTDFGQQMRVMRAARGLSQRELEALTGIPNTYLSQAERGRWVLTGEEEDLVKAALAWPAEDQAELAFKILDGASVSETEAV